MSGLRRAIKGALCRLGLHGGTAWCRYDPFQRELACECEACRERWTQPRSQWP